MSNVDIHKIIAIVQQAGQRVMMIYNQATFTVNTKIDRTPLTQADIASHQIISSALAKLYPAIPVISEEAELHDYAIRKKWKYFFLVDPLDGTKEFIERNGEFTINVALIHEGQPILGVMSAPALGVIYHAELGRGAYKIQHDKQIQLLPSVRPNEEYLRVAISRSHQCAETQLFIEHLQQTGKMIMTFEVGSALKFGLVAEGKADIYPRFTPTMEWDTAAGHVLVQEVGKNVIVMGSEEQLHYNKLNLRNPGFIVQ